MLTITRTRLLAGAATLALTASLGATPGFAQESPIGGTMNVTASVAQQCSMGDIGTLSFGQFSPGEEVKAHSTFIVDCDFAGEVGIAVSGGNNSTTETRKLLNDANGNDVFVNYTLWQEDPPANQWTVNSQQMPVNGGGTTFDVHGVINQQQSEAATKFGTYEDAVTITVTF